MKATNLIKELNKMTACGAAAHLYSRGLKMHFAQSLAEKYSYFRHMNNANKYNK